MKEKLIKWLLKLLGHKVENISSIKIEVDAEEAMIQLKKISDQLKSIKEGIDNLPKGIVSFKEIARKV